MTRALECDAVVVGAGVVGLAVAARFARAGLKVVVLERHPGFGREASSRNSEVVHAGMYYATGSLKARLCVAGNRSLRRWCAQHGVPCPALGKFIVATDASELPGLEHIYSRGRANGVDTLEWSTVDQIKAQEPNVRALAALWSPDTGIVDSHGLMESLADEAARHNAMFAYGATYEALERTSDGYLLRFMDADGQPEHLRTPRVVNAAGLDADTVASGMGIDIDHAGYRLCFVRGAYFRLSNAKAGLVRHLVYPIPFHGLSGLGIHVTLDLAGGIRFGPHIETLADRVQDYRVDPMLAQRFAHAASQYLPGITADDLRPDQAGIRARRIVPGGVSPDWLVVEEAGHALPGVVNMIGIDSPGLTSCLELADHVAGLLEVGGPPIGAAAHAGLP